MRRRQVLTGLLAATLSASGHGQAPRQFRVGLLYFGDEGSARSGESALLDGLRELGYVTGRNLLLEVRLARGDTARLAALADELIALKPDVLLAIEPEASLIRSKTTTIPIVLTASTDPVAAGLVRSLARPGTNVTGLAYRNDELVAKHIELLKEVVPGLTRLALLNKVPLPDTADARLVARFEEVARMAAKAKGLTLVVAQARDAEGVRQAFERIAGQQAQALVVVPTGVTFQLRKDILDHARQLRLPSVSSLPAAWLEAGGLLNYGPNFVQSYRYAATFVDRILRGADPAAMPVEQPARFELAVNLEAARTLGVKIPQSVLLRADRVIE
jgi:putative tryptophan/tyrosine transport system substrate-binding protein